MFEFHLIVIDDDLPKIKNWIGDIGGSIFERLDDNSESFRISRNEGCKLRNGDQRGEVSEIRYLQSSNKRRKPFGRKSKCDIREEDYVNLHFKPIQMKPGLNYINNRNRLVIQLWQLITNENLWFDFFEKIKRTLKVSGRC